MKRIIFLLTLLLTLFSCESEQNPVTVISPGSYLDGPGVFVVNEGNFRSGNGSLSFFSYDSAKIYNDIFFNVNQKLLGDVPYTMNFSGSYGYIVVNNSNKIEVVNADDMKSVKTITGLISPRYISFTGDGRAYISSLYSDSIAIYSVSSGSVSGYVNAKGSTESILVVNSTAYAARWTNDNKILVINTINNKVTDSIEVGMEPESMVVDRNETLWVLCNGGWQRENYAELDGINMVTNTISSRFVFPSKTDSPTCLQIDGNGETLYFLQEGVRKMSISDTGLPSVPLILPGDHNFYKLGINPNNGEIFVTDAVDYLQKGYLLRYSKSGTLISSMQTEIIPGSMYFKVSPIGITE